MHATIRNTPAADKIGAPGLEITVAAEGAEWPS
jgi:hypothetical protein